MPTTHDQRPGLIYAMRHPITHQVRYIGKTAAFNTRKSQHRHDAYKPKLMGKWVYRWWRKVERETGQEPEFVILQECLPGMMDACEREWIARGRELGWKLCNVAEGGEGHALTDEWRKKLSEHSKAKWQETEYVARFNASKDAGSAKRMGMSVEQYREHKRQKEEEKERNKAIRAREAELRAECEAAIRARMDRRVETEGDVAYVPLTNGHVAIIDADDAERVGKHRWSAQRKGRYVRAKTNISKQLVLLNRFVANASSGQMVSHRNGNQLDCRKDNLAILAQDWGRPALATI